MPLKRGRREHVPPVAVDGKRALESIRVVVVQVENKAGDFVCAENVRV